MSLSYSTARELLRRIVSEISDTLEALHTVSIEFTVMREKGQQPSFYMDILFLPAETKNQTT